MAVGSVADDAERVNRNRCSRHQEAAGIMKCVFRFPTKVWPQLDANHLDSSSSKGGQNVSCGSTLSRRNNNKEQTTANSQRLTKQLPSSKPLALPRSLCLLILVAVANSSSGSSTTNNRLLLLGPTSSSSSPPNSLSVSQAGNEKEINGEVAAAQQARRLGLLAAVGADQHGERVPRQVVTTEAAAKQEMGSPTRLVSGLSASGRQEADTVQVGESLHSSAKVLPDYGSQSATIGAGDGQYEGDEEDEEDSQQSRPFMDLMSRFEGGHKPTSGGKLEAEDGDLTKLYDLISSVTQLAPAEQSDESQTAQGQALAPVAKRARISLSATRTTSDSATISSVTTTTTNMSDANSEANNDAGEGGGGKYDAQEFDSLASIRPVSNSIELYVNLTKSLKGQMRTKSNGAYRIGIGGGFQEKPVEGPCHGSSFVHHSPLLFEYNCVGLLEIGNTLADLFPKPTTLRLTMANIETLPASSLQACRESLRDLRIQQTGLKIWPDLSEFRQERLLTSIDLDNNRIESLGKRPINIRAEVVNLEFNLITSIDEHIFNGSEIGALSLSGNRQLVSIHENAFANLKNLIKLDLSSTSLTQLPTVGLHQLRHLKVQDNYALKQIPSIFVFPMLEEAQMTYSFHCCSFRYPKTHDPSAYEEHIKLQNEINAVCSKSRQPELALEAESLRRESRVKRSPGLAAGSPMSDHDSLSSLGGTTTASSDFEGSFFDTDRQQQQPAPPLSTGLAASSTTQRPSATATAINSQHAASANTSESDGASLKKQWLLQNIECGELVQKQTDYQNIICTPEPDAFNPCEDIMGYPILRVAVWLVVACSMFGNMSVIVVLMSIFGRLSVPKFLQLNLAIGDLFMGVYLAMLAGADIATVGTYFNYALDWQHGLGCQLAGASSLFASQLSIFTLIVITFERYYTITYSIDLNMRLQLGWAARIMLIGWCYAFASAMLPIFANINSYSKTSICLPMRTVYQSDKIFILVLLIVDSCAFLIIFICYLRMYLLILKQKTEASLKERTVAMRMALLVLTDFACWAPIIFFSSTAVFGMPLISVTNSKILIVFFYPLNSMANPFLYVLSTRQYRRDLNYVISRWRHWRKNLFKSDVEKDFSNNNFINTYGAGCGPGGALAGKYSNLAINTANLNAVAAMTGVANHLHGYRVSIDDQDEQRRDPAAGRGGQQVELIKLTHDQNDCNGIKACRRTDNAVSQLVSDTVGHCRRGCKHRYRHHRHHHHHHRHHHHQQQHNHQDGNDKQAPRANGASSRQQDNQPPHAQYIIRHQILPNKCALAGRNHALTMSRTLRMITYEGEKTDKQSSPKPPRIKLEDDSKQQQQQQHMRCNTVKLGFVIDSNDNSSSLAGAQEAAGAAEVISMNETRFSKPTSDQTACRLRNDIERGHSADQRAILGEINSKQQLGNSQRVAHKICVCNTDRQRRSTNWTTKLSIRSKDGGRHLRDSPSKSAPTTITTDANSGTNSSQTGGAKSSNEQDLETTATLETTTTTTATTTTGNSDDNQSGSPAAAGLTNGDARQHRSRHNHHHHHHHRHHSRDGHRSRSRCRSRSRSGETSGQSTDVPNGPPVKTVLERITESSNTERSTTPIDQGRREHNDRHHHRVHRNRHHHHHHRCREHQKRTQRAADEREEAVCLGQQKHGVRIQVDGSDKFEEKHRKH